MIVEPEFAARAGIRVKCFVGDSRRYWLSFFIMTIDIDLSSLSADIGSITFNNLQCFEDVNAIYMQHLFK